MMDPATTTSCKDNFSNQQNSDKDFFLKYFKSILMQYWCESEISEVCKSPFYKFGVNSQL